MNLYVKLFLLGLFLTQFTACGGCGAREVFLGTCETEKFTKLSDIVFYGKEARSRIWTESESWKRIVDFSNVPQSIEYKYYCYIDGEEELECKDQPGSSDSKYMIPWNSDWSVRHNIKVVDYDEGKTIEHIAFKPNEVFGPVQKEICTDTVLNGGTPFKTIVDTLASNSVACFSPNLAFLFNGASASTITINKPVKLLALEPNPWDGDQYTRLLYQDGYAPINFISVGSGGEVTLSGFEVNIGFSSLKNATFLISTEKVYATGLKFVGSGKIDTLFNFIPASNGYKNVVDKVIVQDPVADYRNVLIEGLAEQSVVKFSKMKFEGNGANIYVQAKGRVKLEGNLLYSKGSSSKLLKVLSGGNVQLFGNEFQKDEIGGFFDIASDSTNTSEIHFGDNLFINVTGNSHIMDFSGSFAVRLNKAPSSLNERACSVSNVPMFGYLFSNPAYGILGSFMPSTHIRGGEGPYGICSEMDVKPNKYFSI
jgi:hypothetical protein